MRIAYVIDDLHRTGGAQRATVRLVEQAASMPHSVDLFALASSDGGGYTDRLAAAGARVEFFPAPSLLSVRRLVRLTRALRAGGYDLVHTNLVYANIVGVAAARLAGIPAVAGFRTSYVRQRYPDGLRDAIERFVVRRFATSAMAVGPSTAASHESRFPGMTVVPLANAVEKVDPDPTLRARVRSELGLSDDDVAVVAVSSLREVKALDRLIDAVAAIADRTTPEVFIAGTGPLRDELEQRAVALGIEDRVRFLGSVDPIIPLLMASDLFVNCSSREGLSNAILEAMAAGLPVIATDVGDSAHAVGDAGVVVPSGDAGALADAVAALASNPGERDRLGREARRRVRERHSPERWAHDVFSFYEAAVR